MHYKMAQPIIKVIWDERDDFDASKPRDNDPAFLWNVQFYVAHHVPYTLQWMIGMLTARHYSGHVTRSMIMRRPYINEPLIWEWDSLLSDEELGPE